MTTEGELAPQMLVQIVYAIPTSCWSTSVVLGQPATVANALASARPDIEAAGITVDAGCVAVFGRMVEPRARLHDGDRIELLRPLLVSPREARTSRASATRKR